MGIDWNRRGLWTAVLCCALAVSLTGGCSKESTSSEGSSSSVSDDGSGETGAALPADFMLEEKPGGARPLEEAKAAEVGDRVVFQARIGGRAEPFVSGRAVMVVIDPALPSCADNPGDGCRTPWDYCCETPETLLEKTATVRFVDAQGQPHRVSLEDQPGWKPLSSVTIVGKVAEKDESGRFVVNAEGIFLEKRTG